MIEVGSAILGLIVLLPRAEYLLLDNIAVARGDRDRSWAGSCWPSRAEAMRRGYREVRLYTHRTMTENQRLYAAIGYREPGAAPRPGTSAYSCANASLIRASGRKTSNQSDPRPPRNGRHSPPDARSHDAARLGSNLVSKRQQGHDLVDC